MSFRSLKDILPQTLDGLGIGERVRQERVFQALRAAIEAHAPEESSHAVPVELGGSTVTVQVRDSGTSSRLEAIELVLLAAIGDVIGRNPGAPIDTLRFVQQGEAWTRSRP